VLKRIFHSRRGRREHTKNIRTFDGLPGSYMRACSAPQTPTACGQAGSLSLP